MYNSGPGAFLPVWVDSSRGGVSALQLHHRDYSAANADIIGALIVRNTLVARGLHCWVYECGRGIGGRELHGWDLSKLYGSFWQLRALV